MSWIFREHRGGLVESMETAKEFETKDDMLQYIYQIHKDYANSLGYQETFFNIEDIVIDEKNLIYDERCGWNTMYVCVKRYGEDDYIEKYGSAQCIGKCSNEYDKSKYKEWSKNN